MLNRRDFLAITTAGAAVGSGAAAAAASIASVSSVGRLTPAQPASGTETGGPAGAAPRRTLRKAVMYGMIGEGSSVLDRFELLRECGFDGVEMDSPSSIPSDDVLRAMEKTGIKVHGLVDSAHWQFHLNNPVPEVRAKGVEALRTALRDGKTYGSTSVLLVPAVVNGQMGYDDAWKLSMESIREVLPLARETGVKIAIENVWNGFLLSPLEAARYVDEISDPMVAFHFDIGNVINFGWPDQWAKILGKRIVKLHIKDFSRRKRDDEGLWKGFGVEIGEGDAGWGATMRELDASGYATAPDGNWATAEVGGGKRERLKQIAAQMDKVLAM